MSFYDPSQDAILIRARIKNLAEQLAPLASPDYVALCYNANEINEASNRIKELAESKIDELNV